MVTIVTLTKRELVAHDTMAFHFEKPQGCTFRAGQFGDLTLIAPSETDAEGNTRSFSIEAAPYEPDLVFATRLRDTAFKRVLRHLPVGSKVTLDAPYGDFTLHKTDTTPVVFLTGGIGVTPVHSMIAQATHDRTARRLMLLHANRTLDDAPFQDEFRQLASDNPQFTFVPVLTKMAPAEWQGECGHIDAAMLKRHIADLSGPIYYLSGPPGMVRAMRRLLVGMDVDEDNIRAEEFKGY